MTICFFQRAVRCKTQTPIGLLLSPPLWHFFSHPCFSFPKRNLSRTPPKFHIPPHNVRSLPLPCADIGNVRAKPYNSTLSCCFPPLSPPRPSLPSPTPSWNPPPHPYRALIPGIGPSQTTGLLPTTYFPPHAFPLPSTRLSNTSPNSAIASIHARPRSPLQGMTLPSPLQF